MSFENPTSPEVLAPLKSLEGLSFILRNKELWPKDFVWSYTDCGTCAMGLATELFLGNSSRGCTYVLSQLFKCKEDPRLDQIFIHLGNELSKDMNKVTPEDVATALDQYVKEAH